MPMPNAISGNMTVLLKNISHLKFGWYDYIANISMAGYKYHKLHKCIDMLGIRLIS